jgi:hypothetical protein
MAIHHTATNRLAILQKINGRLAALISFNEAHRTASWTDEDQKEHWRLLNHWGEAVDELRKFEGSDPTPISN